MLVVLGTACASAWWRLAIPPRERYAFACRHRRLCFGRRERRVAVMIGSSSPLHRGARRGCGASHVVSGCGHGQGGRGPRCRPLTLVGP